MSATLEQTGGSAAAAAPSSAANQGGAKAAAGGVALPVLVALSLCHFMNDVMQSMIPALYPMLKESFSLDFGQIGMITLAFQLSLIHI